LLVCDKLNRKEGFVFVDAASSSLPLSPNPANLGFPFSPTENRNELGETS
jgi:hypothetical protein